MKQFAILPIAALVIAAGCQDIRREQQAPTEAQLNIPGALLSQSADDGSVAGPSTVCVAYDGELTRARAENDAERVSSLETIIADACN